MRISLACSKIVCVRLPRLRRNPPSKLVDLPIVRKYCLDPDIIRNVARVPRLSDLSKNTVTDVSWLCSDQFENIEQFLASEYGDKFLHALREAARKKVSLWLLEASYNQISKLTELLDTTDIFECGVWGLKREKAYNRRFDNLKIGPKANFNREITRPWAIPVHSLLLGIAGAWRQLSQKTQIKIRIALSGLDGSHMLPSIVKALNKCQIPIHTRSQIYRIITDPKVITYIVVFIYSALRVLPVMLVKEFRGSLLVLWTLDLGTAVPYTWGILKMVTGRTRNQRLLGAVVSIITFLTPYIYFGITGKDYPAYVIVIVAIMIFSGIFLEIYRVWKERRITNAILDVRI